MDWLPEGEVPTPGPVGCGHEERVCAPKHGHTRIYMSDRISIRETGVNTMFETRGNSLEIHQQRKQPCELW